MYAMTHVWRSEGNIMCSAFFSYLFNGSRDGTQVAKLRWYTAYPVLSLASPGL